MVTINTLDGLAEAVGERTRRRILRSLLEDPTPRTVDEVAAAVGVHRTVAFNHLERLAALGLLATDLRRGLPGKPAKLYRAAGPLDFSAPPRRFAELAGVLAWALAGLETRGQAAARQAGRRLGAQIDCLDDLGADHVVEGRVITARNCVFREACDQARAVICGLHASLLETALNHRRIEPLGPLGSDGCRFVIEENGH
ncbi:MAG TPA: helix-turn-helix domain-containing protein [Candidatus Dormibacteraeota bacterium]